MLTQTEVIQILILIVAICALIAILSLRLINAEKNKKRKEEERIDKSKNIPIQLHVELVNLRKMLYDYMEAFPEEQEDCQELLSYMEEAESEAYRLQEIRRDAD
jgi:hypothetical protein